MGTSEISLDITKVLSFPLINCYLNFKGTWKKRIINEKIPKLRFVSVEQGNVLMDLKLDKSSESPLEIISVYLL